MGGAESVATNAVLIITSVGSADEADRIANALVFERLAACVQILPVTSVYRWHGKVERAGELALHIKTTAAQARAIEARLTALHSYELPEFIVLPIVAGSAAYVAWLDEGAQSG